MKTKILLAILLLMATMAFGQTTPAPATDPTIKVNNGVIYIEWLVTQPVDSCRVVPVLVQGNTERYISNLTWINPNRFAVFGESYLKAAAMALGFGNNTVKYRFSIQTIYNNLYSAETKTRTIQIK